MASSALNVQDPGAEVGYQIDFSTLLQAGETIAGTPAWSVTPSDPTIAGPAIAGAVASVNLSSLTLASTYRLEATATTSAGRILVQSIVVRAFPT